MIRKIAPDKWRHFYAGIIMGAVLQAIVLWQFPNRIGIMTLVCFLIVSAISYGFELFSKMTGLGRYDFMDAVATVIGGILGMGTAFIFALLIMG